MEKNGESLFSGAYHLRAEAFCAQMLNAGVPFTACTLSFDSNFKRSFRTDIGEIKAMNNFGGKVEELSLTVNRDGLYDRLPEGLFHQSRGNSKTISTSDMTGEHKRFKEEERLARKFFQPYEQSFFGLSTKVFQEEVRFVFGILNGELTGHLSEFWEIPSGLPLAEQKRLVQIMPWVKALKGDRQKTAKCLAYILGREVTITLRNCVLFDIGEHNSKVAFEVLGENTILGKSFWEPGIEWVFAIRGIPAHETAEYRPGGQFGILLQYFFDLFVPVQIDVATDFDFIPEMHQEENFLGYSMQL